MRQLASVVCATVASALFLTAQPAIAHFQVYAVTFSGADESPPNGSPALGTGTISFDLDLATMRVQANFSGLAGNVTAANIHCCTAAVEASTAGVATPTFPGFPSGGTSGSYDQTFDMALASTYDPSFIAASGGTVSDALNALVLGAEQGRAYFNIRTTSFGDGEVRGFLILKSGEVLDVDADEGFSAATDGLLIVRYMFGLTGTSLTDGAVGITAVRTDPTLILNYLDSVRASLDIDGNDKVDALTDGLLIVRYLLGMRGDALIAGAADPLGARKTAMEIEAYIQSLMQ